MVPEGRGKGGIWARKGQWGATVRVDVCLLCGQRMGSAAMQKGGRSKAKGYLLPVTSREGPALVYRVNVENKYSEYGHTAREVRSAEFAQT